MPKHLQTKGPTEQLITSPVIQLSCSGLSPLAPTT
ncbi:hypothetical protein SLEP1_g11492 [Rubroshorea leprosula]|uniref:Uncharacterized protein n=1 Tax=Rubroshorea leprosula TaxID=152421 RepID=A0AAV5IKP2_9ROSI|nr:hypothetical protein SLEP1_g11492 [Rubroshorea leprosula]